MKKYVVVIIILSLCSNPCVQVHFAGGNRPVSM